MNKKGYVSIEVILIAFIIVTMSVAIAFDIAHTSERQTEGFDNFIHDVIHLG